MLALAKVDKCDKFGNTTLHHAAATGNIFTVVGVIQNQLRDVTPRAVTSQQA